MSLIKNSVRSFRFYFNPVHYYSTSPNSGYNVKRALDKVKREGDYEVLKNILANQKIESPEDVDLLRSEVLNSKGNFSEKNVDRILLNHFFSKGQYRNGINYIEYLNEEIKSKLHLFLTNQTFRMYFYKRYREKSLSTEEEAYLIALYQNLKRSFPVLDVISIENAILALSITKEWKKCLDLFQEIVNIDRPSAICYSAIAAGAFINAEENVAWMILQEMFEKERPPYDVVFIAYIEKLEQLKNKGDILTKLETLFTYCREKDIILSESVIVELCNVLRKKCIKTNLSSINKRGCCTRCLRKLDTLELTNEMFEKLKEKLINNVIVGKNIFSKTNPEEFTRFRDFLKTTNDCSVVIDGLNVAYTVGTKQSTHVSSALLAHVVSHFANRGKNIVVLGRAHMSRWPRKNWSYIKSNARIFLTQDISQDDPYLLYCALHLGKNSIIISRDLMRSHLFLLKDPSDKIMFSRWLSQRQYQVKFVSNDGKVQFEFPLPYTRTMQKNYNNWHIPYRPSKEKNDETGENCDNWLCIQCS